MAENITILHLSDMQFGIHHRFGAKDTELDSLLNRLCEDLNGLKIKPDLIVLSGDLTEWAQPKEFDDLFLFVDGLSKNLNIPHKQIIMISGNHDINRKKCEHYFDDCELERTEPKEPYFEKWIYYKRFFDKFYSGESDILFTEENPYSLFVIEELKIVVAGLNSTMKESHRDGDHYGFIGEKQLIWFRDELEKYKQQGWFRIAAVHHNVQRGAINDDENLKDAADLRRVLKDSVNLVLHGHTHQADLAWLTQKAPILATGSAGLKQEIRPEGVPNQYQIIKLRAQGLNRYCRAFIATEKKWGWDNSVHNNPAEPFETEEIAFENINAAFIVKPEFEPLPIFINPEVPPFTKNSTKIAVLIANPINRNYEYDELLKGFKKLKCEVHHFYLSCDTLNNLDDYDYVFIASKWIKDKIVVENTDLSSRTVSLKELEENIGNHPKGVFIFLDQAIDATQITELPLPTVILPPLSKEQIQSFLFFVFKKCKTNDDWLIFNKSALVLAELQAHSKEYHRHFKTPLPDAIDPKTTQNYVGRVSDLEVICKKIIDLKDEKNGFLTIKGSGGIGKTITVKKIAVELAARNFFPDGIDFVDCEFISDYKLFEFNLAQTFNLEQSINAKEYIRKHEVIKDSLLILDNFETLLHLSDANDIKDFLNFICDYVTVVVTSREWLDLDCEQEHILRHFTTDEALELFEQELRTKLDKEDKNFLRNEIIETLLGNNPLAIKLITKNLPMGKDFRALKIELEEDIFQKLTDIELEAFDSYSDTNIERKKSLYASISFSYNYLCNSEKMVFELLSLFPDGINIENLRRITDKNRENMRSNSEEKSYNLCITDVIINSLDKKSMIENNSGTIKLQSIIGRFAEQKLGRRENMQNYYNNAFDYNQFLIFLLSELKDSDECLALKIFNAHKNNFLKSISYIDLLDYKKYDLLSYLEAVSINFTQICTHKNFIEELDRKKKYFSDDENEKLYFNLLMINSRYFDGDFENSFEELTKIIPKDKVENLDYNSELERDIGRNSINIYGMEGEAYFCTKISEKAKFTGTGDLFYISEYNLILNSYEDKCFFYFEIEFNCNRIDIKELDNYINSLYKKSHIEIMQCYYIKAKIGVFNKAIINKLVIVNPYTQGLQQLIFAFCETDTDKAISLYEEAKDNLKHIKYYYVEALYFYAKFLKEKGLQQQYYDCYQQGNELARKHYFRFLIYKFEDLVEPKTIPYDPKNYPLPDNDNFDDYINFLIKNLKHQK